MEHWCLPCHPNACAIHTHSREWGHNATGRGSPWVQWAYPNACAIHTHSWEWDHMLRECIRCANDWSRGGGGARCCWSLDDSVDPDRGGTRMWAPLFLPSCAGSVRGRARNIHRFNIDAVPGRGHRGTNTPRKKVFLLVLYQGWVAVVHQRCATRHRSHLTHTRMRQSMSMVEGIQVARSGWITECCVRAQL
jgi:hypothetical protein